MQTKTKLIGAAATVAALTAVGVGVAAADPQPSPATPSSSASPSAGSSAKAAKKADHQKNKKNLFKSALHGEATLGAKKQRVIDFQRGTVTAVSGNTVTVKSVDGFSASYVADAKTKVHKDKTKSAIAAVKVNDQVRVVGLKSGSTVTLKAIGDRGPKK